jgi:RNA polymerase sigma factor (sigma-70 family)
LVVPTSKTAVLRQAIRSVEALVDPVDISDRELLRRFTDDSDQAAFAALVRRYTGMVLGVCRRKLPTVQDAEDACQATFLILARKATAKGWRQSVANWLYTTARRVADNARKAADRRTRREGKAAVPEAVHPADQVTGRELLAALDEELDKLAARYREPLVLCYLEGLTRDEVAMRLGVPPGTVKIQLERGRKKLGDALTRRGCGLGAGLLALAVTSPAGAAPPRLIEAVLASASGSPPAAVAMLARGVTMNALMLKQKLAGIIVAAAALGLGLGALSLPAASQQAEKAPPAKAGTTAATGKRKTKEPTKRDEGVVTFAGRVLDPDGKPVAGAQVFLVRPDNLAKDDPKPATVSDEAGRFRCTARGADQEGRQVGVVFATAPGFAAAWQFQPKKTDDVTVRLVKDDVPVSGRIVSLEGKPIAGVTLKVRSIKAPPSGNLGPWLETVKSRTTADGIPLEYQYLPMFSGKELTHLFPPVLTNADGRFTLRGVGRERAVALIVEGPTIETKEINVLTRPGLATISIPWYRHAPELGISTYYSIGFDHAAAPCRTVSGVVRDKVTGKPVAGATVRAERGVGNPFYHNQATTDDAGRYRLTGLSRAPLQRGRDTLVVVPPEGQTAYLSPQMRLGSGVGLEKVTINFDLVRGVWIEGRVTNKATGEGIRSNLQYYVFPDRASDVDARRLYLPTHHPSDSQGRFRFVGVPGRGLLGARARGPKEEQFLIGVGAARIEGKHEEDLGALGVRNIMFPTLPYYANAWDHDTLAEVNPTKGADKVTCNLQLLPGRTQKVRVLDPDGKALTGVRIAGQFAREFFSEPGNNAEVTVFGMESSKPRLLLLQHEGKKLSGVLGLKGTERGPVAIKLQPSASVLGRLVDAEGVPMRHADFTVFYNHEADKNVLHAHSKHRLVTDAEGRFRVGGMVSGVHYMAHVRLKGTMYPGIAFDLTLKTGEIKDLGDVNPKKTDE